MKHPEGLRMSLAEEGMLSGSGVLRSAEGSPAPFGLSDSSIQLFLAVATAGEEGIAQNKLPKELRENLQDALLPLEMQSLVDWERDNRGRKAYLVLTWKGQEAFDAARTKPTDHGTWADRRRAAVTPPSSGVATPSHTPGVRRRASFAGDIDEAVSTPVSRVALASDNAPHGGSAGLPTQAIEGDEMRLGANDLEVGARVKRRSVCKADDALLSSLACLGAEDMLAGHDEALFS